MASSLIPEHRPSAPAAADSLWRSSSRSAAILQRTSQSSQLDRLADFARRRGRAATPQVTDLIARFPTWPPHIAIIEELAGRLVLGLEKEDEWPADVRRAVQVVRTYEKRLSDDVNGNADVREQVEAGRAAVTFLRSVRDTDALHRAIREHIVDRLRLDPDMSVAEILEAIRHETMRQTAAEQRDRRRRDIESQAPRPGPKRTHGLAVKSIVDGATWRVGNRKKESNPFIDLSLPFQLLKVEVLRHWYARIYGREMDFAPALMVAYWQDIQDDQRFRAFNEHVEKYAKDHQRSKLWALRKVLRDKSRDGYVGIRQQFRRLEKNLSDARSKARAK